MHKTITIRKIDTDLWTLVKIMAIRNDITVSQALNKILKEYFGGDKNE